MEPKSFLIVAISSTLIAFLYQLIHHVYPAYRRVKIAESLSILAKCVKKLDKDALPNAVIKNGDYLHDKFYKLIFCVLTHKANLNQSVLDNIKINKNSEKERLKFLSEIESLDDEMKEIINQSKFAIAKILFFRNPVLFTRTCMKTMKKKRAYHMSNTKEYVKSSMVISTEYMTVKARDEDFAFTPC